MSWHFASEDEVREAAGKTWPAAVDVDPRKTGNDIYRVVSGTVQKQGEVHDVKGETIKVLRDETAHEDWAYASVDLVVQLPGGYRGTLLPGTPVAVLPMNYLEMLKDERRTRKQRAGAGSPP